MMKFMRLLGNIMKPECKKCDPGCQTYNKTNADVMNAIRYVTGLC